MMFKLTLIAMIIIFIIGVVVRVQEHLEAPEEEGEHRKHIDTKRSTDNQGR